MMGQIVPGGRSGRASVSEIISCSWVLRIFNSSMRWLISSIFVARVCLTSTQGNSPQSWIARMWPISRRLNPNRNLTLLSEFPDTKKLYLGCHFLFVLGVQVQIVTGFLNHPILA